MIHSITYRNHAWWPRREPPIPKPTCTAANKNSSRRRWNSAIIRIESNHPYIRFQKSRPYDNHLWTTGKFRYGSGGQEMGIVYSYIPSSSPSTRVRWWLILQKSKRSRRLLSKMERRMTLFDRLCYGKTAEFCHDLRSPATEFVVLYYYQRKKSPHHDYRSS